MRAWRGSDATQASRAAAADGKCGVGSSAGPCSQPHTVTASSPEGDRRRHCSTVCLRPNGLLCLLRGFFFFLLLFIFSYGVMVIVLACITSPLFNVAVCCYAATFQLDCWGVIYNSARTIYIYTSPDIVPAFKLYSKILLHSRYPINLYSSSQYIFLSFPRYISMPLFLWRALFAFYLQHWYQNMVLKVHCFNTTKRSRERVCVYN